MAKVTFLPSFKTAEVSDGSTIFQAAITAGVLIESTCSGRGTCGKCKVQIPREQMDSFAHSEGAEKFLSDTELAAGWVLACQYKVNSDVTVVLREERDAHERKTALNRVHADEIRPSIKKYPLTLTKPSVHDQTPDWERVRSALPNRNISFNLLTAANLAKVLRQAEFKITAVLDGESIVAVEQGNTVERCYGLAVDIGTTTVVVYLLDLNRGAVLASSSVTNPQRLFGADVISRISYAAKGSIELKQLQTAVIKGLNDTVSKLCANTGVSGNEIYQAVVVGNTTMSHLFVGIDPTYLAPAPYIPVFRQAIQVEARELGLNILGTGKVIVLPNVAGYVGADTVAVMLATKIDQLPGITLAIDIGTNGEMILAGKQRILTCSTAAGPAFEGAEIRCGMRAAEGAIEGVTIKDDVQLAVIGNTLPSGICGSGLIDAIAEMARSGVVSLTGRLAGTSDQLKELPPSVRRRLRRTDQGSEFVLAWGEATATGEDIVLTQKDVRELQLAKGAIRAGIHVLMGEMGITPEDIDRILLAGAFGNYIKKESALQIGLLPPVPAERVRSVGNAAGDGAKLALLSTHERMRSSALADQAEHVELSTRSDFQEQFVKALSYLR
ncbi:phenol hydroxylase P5 protein [Peptococcaceae bacterium CEB3]|nr:phenol hydroxylase P5 protein [Peptococcaceae bacterium CEB3]